MFFPFYFVFVYEYLLIGKRHDRTRMSFTKRRYDIFLFTTIQRTAAGLFLLTIFFTSLKMFSIVEILIIIFSFLEYKRNINRHKWIQNN